jgi:hypothetical protein
MKSFFVRFIGQKIDLVEAMGELFKTHPDIIQVPVVDCDCKTKQVEMLQDHERLSNEVTNLKKQKTRAEESLAKAELEYKMTIEDIRHMQKMLDEKSKLGRDRVIFEAEKKANTEIESIRKEYSDKMEKELLEERKKMQEFMQQVMAALPNVNVQLGQKQEE